MPTLQSIIYILVTLKVKYFFTDSNWACDVETMQYCENYFVLKGAVKILANYLQFIEMEMNWKKIFHISCIFVAKIDENI